MSYFHNAAFHFHRGPRRLVWFLFGGTFATWMSRRTDIEEFHQAKLSSCQARWRHCVRGPIPTPPPAPSSKSPPKLEDPTAASTAPCIQHPWTARYERERQKHWDEDLDKFWQQANDSMDSMSEKTLDSIAHTIEGLKAKLLKHRIEREQAKKYIEEQSRVLNNQHKQEARHLV